MTVDRRGRGGGEAKREGVSEQNVHVKQFVERAGAPVSLMVGLAVKCRSHTGVRQFKPGIITMVKMFMHKHRQSKRKRRGKGRKAKTTYRGVTFVDEDNESHPPFDKFGLRPNWDIGANNNSNGNKMDQDGDNNNQDKSKEGQAGRNRRNRSGSDNAARSTRNVKQTIRFTYNVTFMDGTTR